MDFGRANGFMVTMGGPFAGGASGGKLAVIVLPAEGWKGAISPYSQEVEVEGLSVNSRVDLTMEANELSLLCNKGCMLVAENDAGTVNVYAIGEKPTEDITVQAILTEVTA